MRVLFYWLALILSPVIAVIGLWMALGAAIGTGSDATGSVGTVLLYGGGLLFLALLAFGIYRFVLLVKGDGPWYVGLDIHDESPDRKP